MMMIVRRRLVALLALLVLSTIGVLATPAAYAGVMPLKPGIGTLQEYRWTVCGEKYRVVATWTWQFASSPGGADGPRITFTADSGTTNALWGPIRIKPSFKTGTAGGNDRSVFATVPIESGFWTDGSPMSVSLSGTSTNENDFQGWNSYVYNRVIAADITLTQFVSETTGGAVTHEQGVSCTQAADIRWYSTNSCSDRTRTGCTSFEGMRGPTILAVLRLKLNTNCSITVSGGTETGHTTSVTNSHQNGYKADIFNNSCIDSWITQKPSYSNPNSSYPSYRDSTGGPIYNDERQTSQPHWDIEVP
jgi:hypothetical protein